jgi:tRNA U34 2-thiouridine synthase MnmA/TrmU
MLRNPRHGYGKAINPCIDCHVYFLKKAAELMQESDADFVITGEVLGQRPMSQRKDALRVVESDCGLEGLLLRPLSARFLDPTVPEQEGWVDRSRLPAIKGRSRKEQFRLAAELGVREYPNPAGGCLLTEVSYASKVRDIFTHAATLDPRDFRLLRIGRHFRITSAAKLIIGRNEAENSLLAAQLSANETAFRWDGGGSPLGVLIGEATEENLQTAGRILLRYTRAAGGTMATLRLSGGTTTPEFQCMNVFSAEDVERFRI